MADEQEKKVNDPEEEKKVKTENQTEEKNENQTEEKSTASEVNDKLETAAEVVKEIMPGVTSVADALKMQDVTLTLKEVSAPTKAGEESFRQLEGLDMSKLIGAPINAAVEAHYNAAKKMLGCINEIGVKDGTVAVVTFSFFKNGKLAKMTIPLLTLVPITAMRIKEMKYDFKIKITTDTSVKLTQGAESNFSYGAVIGNSNATQSKQQADTKAAGEKKEGEEQEDSTNKGKVQEADAKKVETDKTVDKDKTTSTDNAQPAANNAAASAAVKNAVKAEPTFGASFSSKKDSKATQESKYSVESSMDIGLTIVSDDNLPGGISKMIEILGSAVNVYNPNGELSVTANILQLVEGYAATTVSYLDGDGNLALDKITCTYNGKDGKTPKPQILTSSDSVQLLFTEPGPYIVKAGKLQEVILVQSEK